VEVHGRLLVRADEQQRRDANLPQRPAETAERDASQGEGSEEGRTPRGHAEGAGRGYAGGVTGDAPAAPRQVAANRLGAGLDRLGDALDVGDVLRNVLARHAERLRRDADGRELLREDLTNVLRIVTSIAADVVEDDQHDPARAADGRRRLTASLISAPLGRR